MTMRQIAIGCGVFGGGLLIVATSMGSDRALFATLANQSALLEQAAPVVAKNAANQAAFVQQLHSKGCTEVNYTLTTDTPLNGNAGDCYRNATQTAVLGGDGKPAMVIQEGS